MAYDEKLDRRIGDVIGNDPAVTSKKMFGGLCYLYNGNMAFGIVGDELMVRVGAEGWSSALARPNAREMDFTGRSMKGFVYVDAIGLASDDALQEWVELGLDFADSLPPKAPKSTPKANSKSE